MEHPRGTPAAVRCLGLVPAGQGDTKVLPVAMGWVTSVAVPLPGQVSRSSTCVLCATAPSRHWHEAGLDANPEREAPADSTIMQGSRSFLLNGRHFSVSFPLPSELKPPFCSKTSQAKEILLSFQLTESPPSTAAAVPSAQGSLSPGYITLQRDKWSPAHVSPAGTTF